MNWLKKISTHLRAPFAKRRLDREMDEEMRAHVELRTQANLDGGMAPEQATREALREFGWAESLKETCREGRPGRWLEQIAQDLRFGARMLAKSPTFTVTAVIALAVGTGANITIFSIINAILLKPVLASHPQKLVGVYQHERANPEAFNLFSYPDFKDLRAGSGEVFSDLFAFSMTSVVVQNELADNTLSEFVSANYFTALGVPPALGRTFAADEETSGAAVAVLTDAYWRKLGSDPSIVGRKLKLSLGEATVIGVMPPRFTGAQTQPPAIFFPLGFEPALLPKVNGQPSRFLTDRSDHGLMLMARLRPEFTLANVNGRLAGLNAAFAIADPADPKPRTLLCTQPSRFDFGSAPSPSIRGLGLLAGFAFALSALVLIIACLNLANMMIARGAARQKEIAVRLAIGAGRGRILRQLLTEGLLLAAVGGMAGLVVSIWANNLLAKLIYSGAGTPRDFPVFDLSPDRKALGALIAISGTATLIFALAPALKLARTDFNEDLKRGSGNGAGNGLAGRLRSREFLAVGQLALTLALLVAAVGFARSSINAAEINPGYEFGSNFYLAIDAGLSGYPEARVRELFRRATTEVMELPGVESVSSAMNVPLSGNSWERDVQIGGAPPPSAGAQKFAEGKSRLATYNVVGRDYFKTLGIPLQQGRDFEQREVDDPQGSPVAIISQTLANELWPGQAALGRTVQFPGYGPDAKPAVMTVVGVVPAILGQLFDRAEGDQIYVPLAQASETNLKLHVRVKPGANATAVMTAAKDQLRKLDPQAPLTEVKTLAAVHQDGPWMRVLRMGSALFGTFAALAVFLSLLGVYGLKAYSVTRRTREIGVRLALGALRRDVIRMILRESMWLTLAGLAFGIPCAAAVAKFAAPYLFDVKAFDAATVGLVSAGLVAAVMFSCFVPARRASRLNPMVALRHE